jgi:hypothetical protein
MRLLLRPESASYSVKYGAEAVNIDLDGGAGRYRLDIINASKKVNAQWILDSTEFEYLMAFYRSVANRGATTFQIELIIDGSDIGEVDAHFVPDSFELVAQRGLAYTVAAQLEITTPVNPDLEDDDLDIVSAYNTSQGYTP